MIDITGLDKAAVLTALVNGVNAQQPFGLGSFFGRTQVTKEEVAADLAARVERFKQIALEAKLPADTYKDNAYDFDYYGARAIKATIAGNEFDERLYDRDAGLGAAASAIDSIR